MAEHPPLFPPGKAALQPAGGHGRRMMRQALAKLGMSMRAHDRILKVARTIADLAGAPEISAHHLAEALQYRCLDRESQSFG